MIFLFLLQFFEKPNPTHNGHGLIFRAFVYLFQLLQARQDTQFVLKASFLEIYNEKVGLYFLIVSIQFSDVTTVLWMNQFIINRFQIDSDKDHYDFDKRGC